MAVFCTNCAAPLDADTKFCPSCGAGMAPASPAAASPARAPVFTAARGRKYPALRFVMLVLKAMAVLTVIAGVIWGLVMMTATSFGALGGSALSGVGFLAMAGGVLYGVMIWGAAESIQVLIDIEENTRRPAGAGD